MAFWQTLNNFLKKIKSNSISLTNSNNNIILQDTIGGEKITIVFDEVVKKLSQPNNEKISSLEQQLQDKNLIQNYSQQHIKDLELQLEQLHNENVKLQSQVENIISNYEMYNPNDLQKIYNDALLQFANGNLSDALLVLNDEDIEKEAESFLKKQEALETYKANKAYSYLLKGQLLSIQNDFAEAEFYCLKSVEVSPSWFTHFNCGEYFKTQNKFSDAIDHYKNSLTLSSDKLQIAASHYSLGYLFNLMQDLFQAQENLCKAESILQVPTITRNADYKETALKTFRTIGIMKLDEEDFSSAKNNFECALNIYNIENSPKDLLIHVAGLYLNLGLTFRKLKDDESCEKNYLIALKLFKDLDQSEPGGAKIDLSMIYNNLGVLYYNQQKFIEAENYYNKALNLRIERAKINPAHSLIMVGESYFNLGNLYATLKDMGRAYTFYENSLIIKRERAKLYPHQYEISLANTALTISQFNANYNMEKVYSISLAKEAYCLAKKYMNKVKRANYICSSSIKVAEYWNVNIKAFKLCQ